MSDDKTPALEEVLEAVIGSALDDVHTIKLGRIESYDAGSGRAVVQPLVRERFVAGDGNETVRDRAALADVPVLCVGSGGARLRFPIRTGDECLLLIASEPISAWKPGGGIVDPQDDRRHHLADAIAIVGLQSAPSLASTMIDIDDSGIKLGDPGATEPALLGQQFLTALQTMVAGIASAVGGIPTGGAAAAAGVTAALATFVAQAPTYISTKVKLR